MDKVNVILCTYNGERFLPELLDSLFGQTYRNIEIYVRDDCSTDNTKAILSDYARKEAQGIRLHLIEDDLGNLGYARNFARTIYASGEAEYYCFCDQDDYWFPDKIERGVTAMKAYSPKRCLLYTSNYDVCDQNLNVLGSSHPCTPFEQLDVGKALSLFDGGWLLGFTLMMNRTLKEKAFNRKIERIYSHDIWVQAVAVGFGGVLLTDDKVTVHFRRHEKTTSVAESKVDRSFFAAWKYRLGELLGNGTMFQSIHNSINSYAYAFANEMEQKKDADFLRRFADHRDGKKHRLAKALYPHRLKKTLVVEIAWRLAILMGRL